MPTIAFALHIEFRKPKPIIGPIVICPIGDALADEQNFYTTNMKHIEPGRLRGAVAVLT